MHQQIEKKLSILCVLSATEINKYIFKNRMIDSLPVLTALNECVSA